MSPALKDRVVIVTQNDGPGARLASSLVAAAVRVWVVPVVVCEAAPDHGPIDAALERLEEFDWIAFTSVRAVEAVCDHAAWLRWPWSTALRPRVAAVGAVTAACLWKHGIRVALYPAVAGADGLARAMIEAEAGTLAGRIVLWPRSDIARPDLRDALVAAQAQVVDPVVYRTVTIPPVDFPSVVREIGAGRVDAVTFLSPSSAAGLAAAMDDKTLSLLVGRTAVASVGPATSAALTVLGAPPSVEATDRSGGGLADALLRYFARTQGGT